MIEIHVESNKKISDIKHHQLLSHHQNGHQCNALSHAPVDFLFFISHFSLLYSAWSFGCDTNCTTTSSLDKYRCHEECR